MPHPHITDVCLITHGDMDVGIAFYTDKLGFSLRARMPGFADFVGDGIVLALWDGRHISETTGAHALTSDPGGHAVMVAVRLDAPAEIDAMYQTLTSRGVRCYRPPQDYPWNARCIYMPGPFGEVWEFYAWHDGGEPGLVTPTATGRPASATGASAADGGDAGAPA